MALLRRGRDDKISESWLVVTDSSNPAVLHILPIVSLPKVLAGSVAEAEVQPLGLVAVKPLGGGVST